MQQQTTQVDRLKTDNLSSSLDELEKVVIPAKAVPDD